MTVWASADTIGTSFQSVAATGPIVLALAVAALAGLVSFASPCCIPLVPGYLSYLAAVAGAEGTSSSGGDAVTSRSLHRWRVTGAATLFVAGFTVV